MEILSWIIWSGLAIGVALSISALLSLAVELAARFQRRWRTGRLGQLGLPPAGSSQPGGEDTLPGRRSIPWRLLYAITALTGLGLCLSLEPVLSGIRWGLLGLPGLVFIFRKNLEGQQRRRMHGYLRQFLLDLRLHLSLQGSLLLGLESLARTAPDASPIHRVLARRQAGRSARSGLELLQQVSAEIPSADLTRTVQRLQAARQTGGTADLDRVLAGDIEALNETIACQTEEQMQHLPLRITLLAMPFLLGPIVILLFYPLVDRILTTLSGVAVGGGF